MKTRNASTKGGSASGRKKAKKVSAKKGVSLNRKWLITATLVVGALALAYYFKHLFIVGWVNNQPIFRTTYSREVNRLAGQRALDTLMTKRLILQEAQKRQVTVTDEELSQEVAAIEAIAAQQEMSLDELLALQDLDRTELMGEIRIQKYLEKMVGEINVTEEEVETYWEESQEFYPDQTMTEASEQITSQLRQQKLSEAVQAFITNLQEQANVTSWL